MKRSHEGSYKVSPSFEVSLKKSDYYEDVLSKAASTLELHKGVIITASGVIIPNEKLKFDKGSVNGQLVDT